MKEDRQRRLDRKPRWGWYALAVLVLAALILLGVYATWFAGSSKRLDRLIAQYKAAGEPIELADFRDAPVDDDDNIAVALREAGRINTKTKVWEAYEKFNYDGLPLRDDEIAALRAVLAANPRAFEGVDAAMKRKGIDWQIALKSPALSVLLPDLNEQRQLARLIALRALLNAQQGDCAAALADLRKVSFIADAIDHQPFLVSHMVANGTRGMVCTNLQLIAGQLKIGSGTAGAASPNQVAQTIATLLDEKPQRLAQRRAIQGERMLELDTARCLADGRLNISQLTAMSGASGAGAPSLVAAAAGVVLKPMALDDAVLMMQHTSRVVAAIDASPDWPTYKSRAPVFPAEIQDAQIAHLVARTLLPAFDRSIETEFKVLAERRFAATMLAIRWYAVDHEGKLPEKLNDLVPRYLPSVPLDPFARGQPIRYVSKAPDPILYSVGEDGIDNVGGEVGKVQRQNLDKWQKADAVVHLIPPPRPPADDESTHNPTPATTTQTATQPAR